MGERPEIPLRVLASPRRNLSREEAATYVGIGATKFDELVKDGRMPKPFKIDGRVLWEYPRPRSGY